MEGGYGTTIKEYAKKEESVRMIRHPRHYRLQQKKAYDGHEKSVEMCPAARQEGRYLLVTNFLLLQ